MNSRAVFGVGDVVPHIDNNHVTPVCFDQRPRKGTIDKKNFAFITIWGDEPTADCEVVVSRHARVWVFDIRVGPRVCELAPWIAVRKRVVGKHERNQWE